MLLNSGVCEDSWESLDWKEIQPVHSKGDQSWVFIGRTDVEAETPILWPPYAKSWLIWKDPDAGKDWRRKEKGMTEDKMVGWHHWLSGHEFGWTLGAGDGQGGCVLWFMGSQRVGHDWATELNWIDSSQRKESLELVLDYMCTSKNWKVKHSISQLYQQLESSDSADIFFQRILYFNC